MICEEQAGSEETLASSDSFIVTCDNGFKIYSRYFTRATTAAFVLLMKTFCAAFRKPQERLPGSDDGGDHSSTRNNRGRVIFTVH